MVTGNDPENVVIDFSKKHLAEYPDRAIDTHIALENGLDWLRFGQIVKEFEDPEALFQKIRENSPHKLSDEAEKQFRISCKENALISNLSKCTRYLAVVDYAMMTLSQNIVLYFKKGSLVYLLEKKLYYRHSDLLKQG